MGHIIACAVGHMAVLAIVRAYRMSRYCNTMDWNTMQWNVTQAIVCALARARNPAWYR